MSSSGPRRTRAEGTGHGPSTKDPDDRRRPQPGRRVPARFEAQGYEFHAAHSAAEALDLLPRVEPDLILLEVILEDFVAGFRVLSHLRADPSSPLARFSGVPIVMLTRVTSKTHVDFGERVGTALLPVDAFVEKPVKPAELLALVEAQLRGVGGAGDVPPSVRTRLRESSST